jgi:predicted PhzF superfamily epimerase YddE/YHI9
MATTVATANGKLTVTIKYAAETTLMTNVLASIGEALFSQRGPWLTDTLPLTYAEMTAAQKLKLVDSYVRWQLVEVHRQALLRKAQADYEAATALAYTAGTVVIE